jgi:tetratricopeptide (TPR) repeat protein
MVWEMDANDRRLWQLNRRRWMAVVAAVVALTAITLLLFPWIASAYHVEQAGKRLAAPPLAEAGTQAAQNELQRALAWHPENAQAYWLLARTYGKQQDWTAAAEVLSKYVSLRPGDPQGFWELALACEQLAVPELVQVAGQPCGADEHSRRARLVQLWRSAGQSTEDLVRAGDHYRLQEEMPQAIAFYERALLLDPESAQAWYRLAEVARLRNETDSALEAYARVVALSPEPGLTALAHSRRGEILAGNGRWAEACRELARAVTLVPDQGQYHLNYGWYLYRAGSPMQNARVELTKAADLLPDNPWPHLRLADLDFAEKDYATMLVRSQQATDLNPNLFWSWVYQGKALRHLGRMAEAEQVLSYAVKLAPDRAAPHLELGHVLKQLERLEGAIDQYKQATVLVPDNVAYHLNLARAYRDNAQTMEAVEEYRRVLELDPDNATAEQALQDLGY